MRARSASPTEKAPRYLRTETAVLSHEATPCPYAMMPYKALTQHSAYGQAAHRCALVHPLNPRPFAV